MSFANPWGLLGLLSLPVILALHLLKARRVRIVVSNLTLWSFLEAEVHRAKPRRIPITWILLLDLLVAALLSLAWAQPRLPNPLPLQANRQVVIVLDVSSSMLASDGISTRFSQAKAEAQALVNSLGPEDVVTVLAFGRGPRPIGDSRQESLQQLASQIQALQAGETGHALQSALALGLASLDKTLPAEFYVYTDGAYPEQAVSAFAYPIHWRLFDNTVDNQAILALNASPVGENRYEVFARIANYGSQTARRIVSLSMDGAPVSSQEIEIPADSSVPQVWQVEGNPSVVAVSMIGSDPLKEDDLAAIGLQPGGKMRVVLVAENPVPLQQAAEAIPGVDLQVIPPGDYESEAGRTAAELTIFRGYIPAAWPAGQILVVEPPTAQEGQTAFLSDGSLPIPADAPLQILHPDPLLAGVDFGGVRWVDAWSFKDSPAGFFTLVQAESVPLILRGEVDNSQGGRSRLVALLADLSRGNFTKHPAFPILIGNLMQSLRQAPLPPSLHTGEQIALPGPGEAQALRISAPGDPEVEYRSRWPVEWSDTLQPGIYRFEVRNLQGQTSEYVAGVNAGDETESDLRPRAWVQSVAAETSAGAGAPASAGQPEDAEQHMIDLTPWLLAAAALGILLETTLAWRRR